MSHPLLHSTLSEPSCFVLAPRTPQLRARVASEEPSESTRQKGVCRNPALHPKRALLHHTDVKILPNGTNHPA